MSLRIDNSYGTVFQVDVRENMVKANLSTSRKFNDAYKNSYWNATFLGKCVDSAKALTDKDRIHVISGYVANEAGEKNGSPILGDNGKPRHFVNVNIFEFEMADGSGASSKPAAELGDSDSEELPF